jgi:hypothetical protein
MHYPQELLYKMSLSHTLWDSQRLGSWQESISKDNVLKQSKYRLKSKSRETKTRLWTLLSPQSLWHNDVLHSNSSGVREFSNHLAVSKAVLYSHFVVAWSILYLILNLLQYLERGSPDKDFEIHDRFQLSDYSVSARFPNCCSEYYFRLFSGSHSFKRTFAECSTQSISFSPKPKIVLLGTAVQWRGAFETF